MWLAALRNTKGAFKSNDSRVSELLQLGAKLRAEVLLPVSSSQLSSLFVLIDALNKRRMRNFSVVLPDGVLLFSCNVFMVILPSSKTSINVALQRRPKKLQIIATKHGNTVVQAEKLRRLERNSYQYNEDTVTSQNLANTQQKNSQVIRAKT
uniref:POP4 domain-containing protein n=1 Tax=Panagrellus redivivus TaxID=6233 RepID=A0A7E4VT52_PANRE